MLVIIDHFTKFAVAVRCSSSSTDPMEKRHLTLRCLAQLYLDQGACFKGKVIEELCQIYQIRKKRTTWQSPQGIGACECLNRTLLQFLRLLEEWKREWWRSLCGYTIIPCNEGEPGHLRLRWGSTGDASRRCMT